MTETCCAYIPDGYTESAYLAAAERVHPALRFEYRPVTVKESAVYNRAVKTLEDEKLYEHAATWAAGRLISWDLADKSGQPVPVSAATLLALRPPLFFKLQAVLLGNSPGDLDPRLEAAAKAQEEQDRAAAEAAGKTLAEWRAERDAKN